MRRLVIAAVQRRHVTTDQLLAEVEAGAIRGSAVVRRAVHDAGSGAWSLPEADVLAACTRSRVLPRIWPNPELVAPDGTRLPSPDGWIDEVGLAIQVHSREYHLRDADWEGTVQADTLLGSHGIALAGGHARVVRQGPAGVRTAGGAGLPASCVGSTAGRTSDAPPRCRASSLPPELGRTRLLPCRRLLRPDRSGRRRVTPAARDCTRGCAHPAASPRIRSTMRAAHPPSGRAPRWLHAWLN